MSGRPGGVGGGGEEEVQEIYSGLIKKRRKKNRRLAGGEKKNHHGQVIKSGKRSRLGGNGSSAPRVLLTTRDLDTVGRGGEEREGSGGGMERVMN